MLRRFPQIKFLKLGMDGVSSIFVTVATVFSGNTGLVVVLIIGFVFNFVKFLTVLRN
jgi:hypothetical protein